MAIHITLAAPSDAPIIAGLIGELLQNAEKVRQPRSRIVQTLNVPHGKRACLGRLGVGRVRR